MTGPRPQQRQRRMRNGDHRCPPLLQAQANESKLPSSEKAATSPEPQRPANR